MSVNITVAVPLDTVIAIRKATNVGTCIDTIAGITSTTTKAVIEAVKALPYDIKPRGAHSVASSGTLTPCSTEASTVIIEDRLKVISVFLRTMTGKNIRLNIPSKTTCHELACMIQDREFIPPDQQRLIFAGKQIYGGVEDDDYGDLQLDEVPL